MGERMGDAVLLPAKYSPSCYACLRSLAKRGIRTVVVSAKGSVPAFASRYCDEALTVPSPDEDLLAYRDALLSIAARPEVKTFVPTGEVDAYLLAKYSDEFEAHVTGVWPDLDRLRRVHDRLLLAEAAEAAGVPFPETQSFDDVDDWDRELVIKSRYNLLAGEYLDSLSERDAELNKTLKYLPPGERPDREAILAEMNHVPIVQECVPKRGEYLFGALYDRGEPAATFQHRQIRGETYAGGGGSYRESVDIPALEEVGRALLDELDWHGLACIEYMEDAETGEFVLTEINPRMWRSLAFAVAAGADFPYYYWQLANGEADRFGDGYEVGVGGHYLHGELTYLRSVLRDEYPNVERPPVGQTVWEIAASCYDQPNFDYLRLDDPGPFIRGVRSTIPM
ncbi:carboxylate--amine ligase [Halorussus marinus]|uniref:carboxylate--amine ligase n=1 Tax=Halorussus marinus TaxID=2505976 RepID=UPI00106E3BE3|nr:carboxylate--amine ligase [Halorussus marinus]